MGYRIYDETDVSFDHADFDIGFIGNKGGSGFVVIVVSERFDDEGSSPGAVGDVLVGDPDVVKIFKSLCFYSCFNLYITHRLPTGFSQIRVL